MRAASLAVSSVLVASFLLAGACSAEHFPLSLSQDDAGFGEDAGDSGLLAPLESSPPPIIPPSQRLDSASAPLVFDPVRGGVWTANGDVGSVSYADPDTFSLVQEIPVGIDITSVALSPDGNWLAAVDRAAGAVALIDANARAVIRTILVGTHPRAAVWDSANPRWLYVAVEDSDGVAIIDRTAGVLTTTTGVGRLPSGVAVSRLRRELYVTHRIDGKVTIVPLTDDADAGAPEGGVEDAGVAYVLEDAGEAGVIEVAVPPAPPLTSPIDVPLGYEVGDGTQTTPHGTPYGLESLAWYPDGNIAWLPHELLASTHPFQFQTIVFPTVSVVDLSQRAEVQTDPFDPNGVVAGRKNLFAAIDLFNNLDSPIVISQPCGVAFHPNGLAAYAIACGSEDLLTFDCSQGIAVDILQGLPGDHPVGIALDTAGARAFVLDDESADPAAPAAPLHSKSLHVYDTAGGSVVGHVTVLGKPITLVAKDPVDPNLRAGLRFFYRANSQKGEYATTGNDWLSCNACHLDGFVTTNNALLSVMGQGIDPLVDARIGHSGLVDFFSTSQPSNAPNDPPFNPHDILSALTEMGGLSPDRTGATRTGAIDPSAPPSDAVTMASQIATVIARDLPIGPTWLLAGATKPNTSYDGAWCGQCHAAQYAAWQKSAHAHAAVDPMVLFCTGIEQQNNGVQYSRLCAGCHDPVTSRTGDTSLTSGRGITCLGCHDAARTIRAGGNEDLQVVTNDWTVDHAARAAASLPLLRDPRFCGTCHEQFVPGDGLQAISTLAEYQAGTYAGSTDIPLVNPIIDDGGAAPTIPYIEDAGGTYVARCVDCHAPVYQGVADHSMVGGNVYLASEITNDSTMAANEVANLQSVLTLAATRTGQVVYVTITNRASGHSFPTGVTDIREPWVELDAVDANKNVVAVYGGPAPDGTIPLNDARLGIDISGADGGLLLEHELSRAVGIPFNRVIPPHGSVQVILDAPASLPPPAVELDAVVYYRNVRTTYLRLASDSGTATAPTTEMARIAVP